MHFNLLVIYCSNLEESLDFYSGLGLSFVREKHGTGPVHYSSELGGLVFELYPEKKSDSGEFRPHRFGLVIPGFSALSKKPPDLNIPEGADSSIVRDPDGNFIHLSGV